MSEKKKKTKGRPSAVDVHVGNRLRVRRSLLGLSQEKLSETIGLTFQQIQKYERGMNRISAGRLYDLSKVLQVPVSYFFENMDGENKALPSFGFSDNEQDEISGKDIMQTKETLDLVRAYYSIEDSNIRKDVLRLMKSMSEKK